MAFRRGRPIPSEGAGIFTEDDRDEKLPLYARAGIAEVWLVNLEDREIDVHREPSASGYAEIQRVRQGVVRPLAFPDDAIELEAVLAYAEERGFGHFILAEPGTNSDVGLTAVSERIDAGAVILLGIVAANAAPGRLALERAWRQSGTMVRYLASLMLSSSPVVAGTLHAAPQPPR